MGEDTYGCILCGSEPNLYESKELFDAHKAWGEWYKRHGRRGTLFVPAAELENLDLKLRGHDGLWSMFWRAILDDPKSDRLFLSGISPCQSKDPFLMSVQPAPIIKDPDTAVIWPGRPELVWIDGESDWHTDDPSETGKKNKRRRRRTLVAPVQEWNVDFHVVDLLRPDKNRKKGEYMGYVMHPHCWLLIDRFLGHDLVNKNLRGFVDAVTAYWQANPGLWGYEMNHNICEYRCYSNAAPWIKQNCDWRESEVYPFGRFHVPQSPLRISDIQELIARATRERERALNRPAHGNSTIASVPTDVAMLVVDALCQGSPTCAGNRQDILSLLQAFQWTLPDSYWQARCDADLVFEIKDVINTGTDIDWAVFSLGLQELLLKRDWYCNSGLFFRGRILHLVESIKGSL